MSADGHRKGRRAAHAHCSSLPAGAPFAARARPRGRCWIPLRLFALGLVLVVVITAPLERTAQAVPSADALALGDYAGKVVVMHFWATWCAPCLRELPALSRFAERRLPRLRREGLVLLTVSRDLRERDLQSFLREQHPGVPVYLDMRGDLAARLGVRGLPTTLVLGPGGTVVARLEGEQEWMGTELTRYFEELLERLETNHDH